MNILKSNGQIRGFWARPSASLLRIHWQGNDAPRMSESLIYIEIVQYLVKMSQISICWLLNKQKIRTHVIFYYCRGALHLPLVERYASDGTLRVSGLQITYDTNIKVLWYRSLLISVALKEPLENTLLSTTAYKNWSFAQSSSDMRAATLDIQMSNA